MSDAATTSSENALLETNLPLPAKRQGKVRDIYDVGGGRILIVASDRISAFDVVMTEPIADKGRVLTAMTAFWFDQLSDVVSGHLLTTDLEDLPEVFDGAPPTEIVGRSMVCRRAEMLPLECIVRGHITGSAWKEYQDSGTMHGETAPRGLREADRLPEPVFTPSTKAENGHDVNISFAAAAALVGRDVADQVRNASLVCYQRGSEWAAERGVIIADTKFEFGMVEGELLLADEVMTPDSSRFWPADGWIPDSTPPSFDKQPVRDFLQNLGWDKQPPPPPLPSGVIDATSRRYVEAYELITGRSFADWPGAGV